MASSPAKTLSNIVVSVYLYEEKNFVAFCVLSHCSDTRNQLTCRQIRTYSGAWW